MEGPEGEGSHACLQTRGMMKVVKVGLRLSLSKNAVYTPTAQRPHVRLPSLPHLERKEVYPGPSDAAVVGLGGHDCKGHPKHLGHCGSETSALNSHGGTKYPTPVKGFARRATRPAPSGLGMYGLAILSGVFSKVARSGTSGLLRRTRLDGSR